MTDDGAFDLKTYLKERKALVDRYLQTHLPKPEGPAADIVRAMTYSLFAGGKRLRPILCLGGAEAVGGRGLEILPVACALELIHTYSLIHDDLPAMDNDDLRRGKPSNHKVYGEALALLAGDALLTEAFHLMALSDLAERVPPSSLVKVIGLIARAAGFRGMVGGQVVDIQSEKKPADLPLVEFIHTHKTGALIAAAVDAGAILGGGNESQLQAVSSYGEKIGLAFQISDDILDIEGDPATLGKKTGTDEKMGKITYPAVLGLGGAKKLQLELVEVAVDSLRDLGQGAEPLRRLARYIAERKK